MITNNLLSDSELMELDYKLNTIRSFLIENNGIEYKLYNHICPTNDNEPDSNIIEYFDDIIYLIDILKG